MKRQEKWIGLLMSMALMAALIPTAGLALEGETPPPESASPTATTETTPQTTDETGTPTKTATPVPTLAPTGPVPGPSEPPAQKNTLTFQRAPRTTTWAPILAAPIADGHQTLPYGARLKDLKVKAPAVNPDFPEGTEYEFKWYIYGGSLLPFGKGPAPGNGEYQLTPDSPTEFIAVCTAPFGGEGIIEGNSYVLVEVTLVKRRPAVTGHNEIKAVYGRAAAEEAAVNFTYEAAAYAYAGNAHLSIGGIESDSQRLQADLDSGAVEQRYVFSGENLKKLGALAPGVYDILLYADGDACNEALQGAKIGTYTVEKSENPPTGDQGTGQRMLGLAVLALGGGLAAYKRRKDNARKENA